MPTTPEATGTYGALFGLSPGCPPGDMTVGVPVPSDPLATEWEKRTKAALGVYDAIQAMPAGTTDPDEAWKWKLKLAMADRILGFRRGGIPLPPGRALGVGQVEVKDGDKVIRLRWADGRPVKMDLYDPMRREVSPDGDDD